MKSGQQVGTVHTISNLGIIIIDEEHGESYKVRRFLVIMQEETAQRRAEMEGAEAHSGIGNPVGGVVLPGRKGRILPAGDEEAGEQTKASVCLDWRYSGTRCGGGNRSILGRYARAAWDVSRGGGSRRCCF